MEGEEEQVGVEEVEEEVGVAVCQVVVLQQPPTHLLPPQTGSHPANQLSTGCQAPRPPGGHPTPPRTSCQAPRVAGALGPGGPSVTRKG